MHSTGLRSQWAEFGTLRAAEIGGGKSTKEGRCPLNLHVKSLKFLANPDSCAHQVPKNSEERNRWQSERAKQRVCLLHITGELKFGVWVLLYRVEGTLRAFWGCVLRKQKTEHTSDQGDEPVTQLSSRPNTQHSREENESPVSIKHYTEQCVYNQKLLPIKKW